MCECEDGTNGLCLRRRGWALLFLGLLPGAAWSAADSGSAPPALLCQGSDPAWSLRIQGESALFTPRAEDRVPAQRLRGWYQLLDAAQPPLLVWRGASGKVAPLVAFIHAQPCAGPAADAPVAPSFTHTIWLSAPDGAARLGCCR